MKTQVITSPMGEKYEVEAYVPLFEFATTPVCWVKAITWGAIVPLAIFAIFGALSMMFYILIAAGLYGIARKGTPAAMLLYAEAAMVIAWWIAMGSIIALGAALAAFGG